MSIYSITHSDIKTHMYSFSIWCLFSFSLKNILLKLNILYNTLEKFLIIVNNGSRVLSFVYYRSHISVKKLFFPQCFEIQCILQKISKIINNTLIYIYYQFGNYDVQVIKTFRSKQLTFLLYVYIYSLEIYNY